MESVRLRKNQYKLTLRRDVLADTYKDLAKAPVYVEKGVITDANNPLILNKEGLNVNQIKTSETLLKDKSDCQWLVAYVKKGELGKFENITVNVKGAPGNFVQLATSIENWKFYNHGTNNPLVIADNLKIQAVMSYLVSAGPSFVNARTTTEATEAAYTTTDTISYGIGDTASNLVIAPPGKFWLKDNLKVINDKMQKGWQDYDPSSLFQSVKSELGWEDYEAFVELQNIVNVGRVKDSTGRYFKVSYSDTSMTSSTPVTATMATLFNVISTVTKSAMNWTTPNGADPNNKAFAVIPMNGKKVTILLTEEFETAATAKFPGPTTSTTENPLYDIICMPYKEEGTVRYIKNGSIKNVDGKTNLAVMYSIVTARGGDQGSILDLQLLPYCPVQSVIDNLGRFDYSETLRTFEVKDGANNFITAGFIAPSGEFTIDINQSISLPRPSNTYTVTSTIGLTGSNTIVSGENTVTIPLPLDKGTYSITSVSVTSADRREVFRVTSYVSRFRDVVVYYTVPAYSPYIGQASRILVSLKREVTNTVYDNTLEEDVKIANECDMYRLTSPNYNGSFEFSLVKNNRKINKFNVDCSYKPFNPYIHVNPDFDGLYGQDFDDARGLVCNGDFSIGIVNNAFQAYEIQNKNYQNIFDRQIQNMDVNNAIARQEAGWQAVAGTLQGAGTGAMGVGMASGGNPYAAAAGAVVGGVISAVGGGLDIAHLQDRQQEARSFAIDNFNMSLQNIKALPQSISKTSPITNNNKKFPFVEYYTCTDVEKTAFKNKLKYDGMTVGVIDELENWVSGEAQYYFKGRLIRSEGFSQDAHLVEEINNELYKGVYL